VEQSELSLLNDVYRIRVELICRSGVGSVSMDCDVNSVCRSNIKHRASLVWGIVQPIQLIWYQSFSSSKIASSVSVIDVAPDAIVPAS
jgi:hypothetical protein